MLKPGITERWAFRDRFRLARALARADVILLDDSFPPLNWVDLAPGRPDHPAVARLRRVQDRRLQPGGKPGDLNPFSRVHKNYTAAIVSSEFDVPFYAEAFGIPEERVVPTGIPRMDRFFDEDARAAGVDGGTRGVPGDRRPDDDPVRADLPRRDDPRRLLRLRACSTTPPSTRCASRRTRSSSSRCTRSCSEPLAIPEAFRDRLLDGSTAGIDVNDLLFAVDLLITDYSSIVFEYSTLGRPMLFFAYDLDEYVATRDFYVPFESFVPGRIVRTFPELLDAIRRDDYEGEKVAAFAARHFAHLDGGSTDRVIDELIVAS